MIPYLSLAQFRVLYKPRAACLSLDIKIEEEDKWREPMPWGGECQQRIWADRGVQDASLSNVAPYPILCYHIILYSIYFTSQSFFVSILEYVSYQSCPLVCSMKMRHFSLDHYYILSNLNRNMVVALYILFNKYINFD